MTHNAPALGREAHAEREAGTRGGADAVDDLEQEARAVFGIAAIGVVAPVEFGAEERADEIAVRAVQFDAVEAGAFGAPRGGDEAIARVRTSSSVMASALSFSSADGALGLFSERRPP